MMNSLEEFLYFIKIVTHYIPIVTFIFSLFFAYKLFHHLRGKKNATYLSWWFIGILTYAIGTYTEGFHALFGWNYFNYKAWYISGALLGGFPLAQGTAYLILKRKQAYTLSIIFVTLIVIAAICVAFSPVNDNAEELNRLTGKVLTWTWVRGFSPFINTYAMLLLVGGAIYSAYQYKKMKKENKKVLGNIYIAVGALLPGIGGTFTRFGYEEVLFVTELIGILFVYKGYIMMKRDVSDSIYSNQH